MQWKHVLEVLTAARPGPLDAILGFFTAARAVTAWSRQRELLALDVLRRYAGVGWRNDPLFHVRHRYYLSTRLTMRERVDCAVTHYRYEDGAYVPAYKAAVYRDGGLVLWTRAVGDRRYALVLRGATTLRHEGGTSLLLLTGGEQLCEMSFAWVPGALMGLPGDVVALVTKNQSAPPDTPRMIRFRADFPQNAPAYFCLAAMHGIAAAHGHAHIAGIRHDCQIAFEPRYAESFRRSYCDFWRAFGGVACGRDAFAMPVPLVPPPLAGVKAKHRKRAIERRRHWTEIADSAAAITGSHLAGGPPPQTEEPWRAMQVSSTSSPARFHQFSLEKISTSE